MLCVFIYLREVTRGGLAEPSRLSGPGESLLANFGLRFWLATALCIIDAEKSLCGVATSSYRFCILEGGRLKGGEELARRMHCVQCAA